MVKQVAADTSKEIIETTALRYEIQATFHMDIHPILETDKTDNKGFVDRVERLLSELAGDALGCKLNLNIYTLKGPALYLSWDPEENECTDDYQFIDSEAGVVGMETYQPYSPEETELYFL